MAKIPAKQMKLDLQVYGALGFQPHWLERQVYALPGEKGRNVLKEIVDACLRRDIDVCAITSTEWKDGENFFPRDVIPEGSVHDRLGYLIENYFPQLSKEGYRGRAFGPNSFTVFKNDKGVILLSSQAVITLNQDNKRIDHLVIGSNQVPNRMSLEETMALCKTSGLVQLADHIGMPRRFGLTGDELKDYVSDYDAVIVHDSQMFPFQTSRAKKLARTLARKGVAVSSAKVGRHAGMCYIEMPAIAVKNETSLLEGLRGNLRRSNFVSHEGYLSLPQKAKQAYVWYQGLRNREAKGV